MVRAIARHILRRSFGEVVVEISSGLGNQMFQYAAGRALALRMGGKLSLMVKDYSQDYIGRTYGLDAFNIQAAQIGYWARSVLAGKQGWRGALASLADTPINPLYLDEAAGATPGQILAARPPVLLSGYFQQETFFADFAPQIRAELTPTAPLTPEAAALAEQMRGPDTCSIHIRRGDYAHHPVIAQSHGTLPASYYQKAMAALERQIAHPRYFIFSDEPAFAQDFLPWPTGTVIVDTPPTAPAWQDMHLMRGACHHIIANSTYSWWAAWLGEVKGSITIAPQAWAKSPDNNHAGIIPMRWLRI